MIEKLAALAHEQWAGWMRYLETKVEWREGVGWVISEEVIIRWQRQIHTAYEDLPEAEKESDRIEARKVWAIVLDHFRMEGRKQHEDDCCS